MIKGDVFVTTVAFLLLFFSLLVSRISGELVASLILPHGDFALDPSLLPEPSEERRAAEEVSAAARGAGSWLAETVQPELLIVSTPHGMELTRDFALYMGSSASGYADIGRDLHNRSSIHRRYLDGTVALAPEEANDLMEHLLRGHAAVSGILNFADSEDMALRWGEAIPLMLLGMHNKTTGTGTRRRHIILSHPLRRYSQSPSMVPELVELGQSIFQWAEARPERIAVLVSADLSHTHRSDGPYGYSNASAPFDAAVRRWAGDPVKNAGSMLIEAASLQDRAMSCGFTGMVMLHGCLSSGEYVSEVLAVRNATYYGMMVATFAKVKPAQHDSYQERVE